MAIPIKEHTLKLGIKGKTLDKLKAIHIHTLEDLAESSIDTVRDRLMCTRERAMVLIMRAKRTLHHHHSITAHEAHLSHETLSDK